MSYPQGYDPYPQQVYNAPKPNGGTAIAAGVLACLGCIPHLFSGVFSIILAVTDIASDLTDYDTTGLFSKGWFRPYFFVVGVVGVLVGVALGVGAVALFLRKSFGRTLIVIACVAVVLLQVVGYVFTAGLETSSTALTTGLSGFIGLIFPVITAVLALLPLTTRWLNYTPPAVYPGPAAGYPGAIPPYPGAGYPGAAPSPYSGAPASPYPGATPAPYPGASPYPPYPGGAPAYPGASPQPGTTPYPGAAVPNSGASPWAGTTPYPGATPNPDATRLNPDATTLNPDATRVNSDATTLNQDATTRFEPAPPNPDQRPGSTPSLTKPTPTPEDETWRRPS
ncbi:hypothetical protein [Nocardia sp. NPDC052566]|uniref:hypothetical protein n=1 Tax=Nocardia sp. NPDC052566 TaxID=3364330 RepID=UPI0037CABC0A